MNFPPTAKFLTQYLKEASENGLEYDEIEVIGHTDPSDGFSFGKQWHGFKRTGIPGPMTRATEKLAFPLLLLTCTGPMSLLLAQLLPIVGAGSYAFSLGFPDAISNPLAWGVGVLSLLPVASGISAARDLRVTNVKKGQLPAERFTIARQAYKET